MKSIRKIGLLLLAILLIIPFADVEAQKRKRKKSGDKQRALSSYVYVDGGAGYSALLHSINETSVAGGGTGFVGFGYMMKHKSNFNFRGGLELMYFNSMTKLDPMNYIGDYKYSNTNTMKFTMNFNDYREQHNRFSLNIPLLFGAQFNNIYFLVGPKVGIGLMGNYSAKSDLTTIMTDEQFIEDMTNIGNHYLVTSEMNTKGKLNFGLDVALSAEVGACIDPWMPSKAKEFGSGSSKHDISYRVGMFVDYGFLNVNSNAQDADLVLNKDNTVNGDCKTIMLSEAHGVKPYSVLATNRALDKATNPFVVGAKFTVMFGIDKEPKPVKKKPRRRPNPRPVEFIPDPTFFYLFVNDFETGEPLDAAVKVFTLGEKQDTIFAGMTDKETGFVEEQIDNGMYGLSITRPGYIDYADTLFRVISDTIYVDLQPIKKNTVVILRNLLFDTDKTVIRNVSAPSLEELYQLLLNNPNMRIRITGHTDNVGTERYNKRLSEGRAKAVYDEMVKRGIDPSRMEWNGRGSKEPIESNKTPEGRAENRRVEFKILSD